MTEALASEFEFVSLSPTLTARRAQAFPTLSETDIQRMQRFGTVERHADGDRLIEAGKRSPGMFVVLRGRIRVTGRDSHGVDLPVVVHGPGEFTGELTALSGGRSFVDASAAGDTETLFVDHDRLHQLLIAEASLGERLMRAMILRRVGLLETGAGGPVLVGEGSSSGVARLANFLMRNGVPHVLLDARTDPEARALVERYALQPEELPLALCPNGTVLRNPTEAQLARCIGMLDAEGNESTYDTVIVGAGPAGLAAAVYAASEGLSVLVIDQRAFGGQAGASARIENYLGFPTGISGQALAGRAYTQAQKFGAHMWIPSDVVGLDCSRAEGAFVVRASDGRTANARSVIVASGARYRRPELAPLRDFEGRGVFYWASPIEARMCAGEEVVLVGGGNSAGQAAVFLSGFASKVWMLVRGPGLAESMSRYLIDRIESIPNIELLVNTQLTGASGTREAGLESVTWRTRGAEAAQHRIRNVFLFLGADPCTEWLAGCGINMDAKGFIRTGGACGAPERREFLETNVPGVFAIGDVRSGSVKRVGGAIGEGAAVVAQIHQYLATRVAALASA